MANETTVTISGMDLVLSKLMTLSPKGNRQVWRNAFRDAARLVFQKEAAGNLRAWGYRALARQVSVYVSSTDAHVQARVKARRGSQLQRVGHWLEHGTRPHTIRVKNKKVLVAPLMSPAMGAIFGKRVDHPGAKARPWLLTTVNDANRERFAEDVARRLEGEADKAQARGL